MSDSGEQRIELSLPAARAARAARRALANMVSDLRARDRTDLMVLVNELVTAVASDLTSPVTLEVIRDGTGIRVEARSKTITDTLDPLAEDLLEKLASSWFVEPGLAAFTLDHPYTVSADSGDSELFIKSASGDSSARAELARRYEPFARSLARRFAGPSQHRDELEAVAAVGLVKALDRFDPGRGVKFTTYAAKTINGELKRFLRDSGWSLRVPRGLQELGLEAKRSAERFAQQRGREPTMEELAGQVDAELDEVGQALLARESFAAASLDSPTHHGEGPGLREALPDHDRRLRMAPEWADLSLVMERLPERQRHILFLRFYEDLSQSEIADRVGISQMHVSRLLAKSVAALREWVEGDE